MPKVTIIGAGIAGLSSGWLLKQRGVDFTIIESQAYPGGLARSFEWNGFSCDFAAHRLFTSDENVLHQLLNLVPMGRQIRRSRIYLRGHWMRDPLDVLELVQNLSVSDRLKVLLSFLMRNQTLEETSFENYVLRRYGSGLYQYFFQPYTEKLFGIPGDEISVLWARQKVRLANPLDNLRENTKTKFQYFYYPIRGGYGAIANRLFEEIRDCVVLNARVTGFDVQNDAITNVHYVKDGYQLDSPSDAVISTLPLSLTTKMLGHTFNFQFQKVDAVYLLIDKPFLTDYHWIYFIDSDVSINRMVEFKNMSPVDIPTDKTVVCAEVTQPYADPINRVVDDLQRVGLIQKHDVLDSKVIHEKFAYPVYTHDYDEVLKNVQQVLSHYKNLYNVGRAAEFRHREVDDNFASAIQTVDQITKGMPEVTREIEKRERMRKKVEKPNVFAVVLAFNNYQDTHECLESLLASDFSDLRIVLVDNGSSDQTPDKVRHAFPHVQIIETGNNLGVPAGYNVGFRHALQNGADYILMLNNDTVIAADMIPRLLEQAESDPDAGIVMPKVLYYGSNDQIWSSGGRYRRFPPAILFTDRRKDIIQAPVRLIEYAPSCGLLIHRRAFERVGLFDPGYFFMFDDWDFSERVRAHGLNIWFVRDAVMWHKVSRTTRGPRSPLFWYTMGASIARFYRRHGRPVWLAIPVHISYFVLREFGWKRNWEFWGEFWRGVRDGLQKPLGSFPEISL